MRIVPLSLCGCAAIVAVATTSTRGIAQASSVASAPAAYEVVATFTSAGGTPHFPAVDPIRRRVYVSNLAHGTVTAFDAWSGQHRNAIRLGGVLHTAMVDATRHLLFVADIAGNALDVIDTRTERELARVPVAAQPHGVAIDRTRARVYVSCVGADEVDVVDVSSPTARRASGSLAWRVVAHVRVGPQPWGVAVDEQQRAIWSADTGQTPAGGSNDAGKTVTQIDATTLRVIRTVEVGSHPWHVAVDPVSHCVFVSVTASNLVAVIHDGRMVARIPVGRAPHGIVVDGSRRRVFVNNARDDSMSVIDADSWRVLQTVHVGKQPQGIALDSTSGRVIVADQSDDRVTVVAPLATR
ncbi:MAG: YncE family protein [Firmicutes bacterium]|nr:YncE family protein [Bacillota bacterium]